MPGYTKDWSSGGGCVPSGGEAPACSCDPRGSLDPSACLEEQYCRCRDHVEGNNCDRCRPGTFNLDASNQGGCKQCFCSGVTDECGDARLFWSTLRLFANMKYALSDRAGNFVKERGILYDDMTREMVYRLPPEEDRLVYYWQLPAEVTGNKMGAYGGNLTVIHRVAGQEQDGAVNSPAVVILGGGLTLVYPEEALERMEGEESKYKVALVEGNWMVDENGVERPATRSDILTALTDIQVLPSCCTAVPLLKKD